MWWYHNAYVKVMGQLVRVGSLLPLCGSIPRNGIQVARSGNKCLSQLCCLAQSQSPFLYRSGMHTRAEILIQSTQSRA